MNYPRSSIAMLTFALVAVSVAFRALPPVEAGSSASPSSIPSRYLAILPMPPSATMIELQAEAKPAGQAEVSLPEGKGKDVTQRVCSGCHGINVFAQQRHTSEKWSSIIDTMVSRGLDASDEDLATINTYLATYLAPAKDTSTKTPDAPPNP